jgi:hypothetical protein
MDWNRAKSMVAQVGGLDVVFEDDNGQLGAVRLPGMPTGVRQPTAWGKNEYLLEFREKTKSLKKQGPQIGALAFIATEAEALNWAQSMSPKPGYCSVLAKAFGNRFFLVWSSCPGYEPTADIQWG